MLQIFKALSDETRLRIVCVVWQRELCVCEIEAALGLTQSNASKHLSILKNSGLLICDKRAQWMYYRLNPEFCRENAELCAYLKVCFETIEGYQNDKKRAERCREQNLCGPNGEVK